MKNEGISDFSTLVKQHAGKAYSFAYRLTGNDHNARELVQQSFIKAFKHLESYEHSRPFAPWVNRIMRNTFLDGVRQVKSRRTLSLDGPSPIEDMPWEEFIPGTDRTPLEQMEKAEMHVSVVKALNSLPPTYKRAVTLCDIQKFSYLHISKILRCPLGTIRSRIHHGRILLREAFERVQATPCQQ